MAGRACDPTPEGIRGFAEFLPQMRKQLEDAKFHLELFAAIAMSQPATGSFRFTWTERIQGGNRVWHSDEDVFRIVQQHADGPFQLTMRVMGGKTCSAGPFHSLESAKEGANRIWNYMLESNIHHSQVIGGGFVGVVSRVLFPDL